jgi:hypothetical protein
MGEVAHEMIVHGTLTPGKPDVMVYLPLFRAIVLTNGCLCPNAARCTMGSGTAQSVTAAHSRESYREREASMGNQLLTGAVSAAHRACGAAFVAAFVTVFAAAFVSAFALSGCANQPDYVKPTATTATVTHPAGAAPAQAAGADRAADDRRATAPARE